MYHNMNMWMIPNLKTSIKRMKNSDKELNPNHHGSKVSSNCQILAISDLLINSDNIIHDSCISLTYRYPISHGFGEIGKKKTLVFQ